MTASATANTPGAWREYIASNAISASDFISCLHLQAVGNNQVAGTDNSMLLDIGKGAAGSEEIVAEGIAVGGAANSGGAGPTIHLPVKIPGATRVAMRVRAATGGRVLTLQQLLASGQIQTSAFAEQLPAVVDVLGTSPSTSAGTAMAGASGSWTQITAGTAKEYQAIIVIPSGPASSGVAGTTNFTLTLGTGQAGQETELSYCTGFYNTTGSLFPLQMSMISAVYGGLVPVGTRIAVRHNLSANPERVTACVIGIPFA